MLSWVWEQVHSELSLGDGVKGKKEAVVRQLEPEDNFGMKLVVREQPSWVLISGAWTLESWRNSDAFISLYFSSIKHQPEGLHSESTWVLPTMGDWCLLIRGAGGGSTSGWLSELGARGFPSRWSLPPAKSAGGKIRSACSASLKRGACPISGDAGAPACIPYVSPMLPNL